jgi:NAD(P)H-hydrate epimerase
MKILSAREIREWDQFTIEQEPVSSINLMERAASECVYWLMKHYPDAESFAVFCGKGNNGGDGLAIARMLIEKKYPVNIYILEFGHKGTDDFQTNLSRLQLLSSTAIHFVQSEEHFPSFSPGEVIIDALFGSGLNRSLEDVTAKLVSHINESSHETISIDIPSGLFVDHSSKGNPAIIAKHTLSFQCYKLAFLLPENASAIGDVHILDIGLQPGFLPAVTGQYELLDEAIVRSIHKPRNRFSHKGNFGHALMVAGSYGKIGAAVLSAKACLRSGPGLLTCHIPKCGYDIMQTSVPEAMVLTDFNSSFLTKIEEDLTKYEAIGIGPGLGNASETKMLLREVFDAYRSPVVIDADALNILGSQKSLYKLIPAGSILTPHPKEFERLFGETANDFERIQLALQKAKELNSIIVLKGHHTLIATPDQKGFFNSTGNAGMATGGSGDVLTGILTGLLAQGYSSSETALIGVYLHGLAGDLAANELSMEAMVAGDIIHYMSEAFLQLQQD